MSRTYGRGSEWRRWDLHIHTPGTATNDQFGDWEEYLAAVEAAEAQVAVVGITDYLTLRSYKKVLTYRLAHRLENIELIIPNIEFRLTPVTKGGKAINLHLLVSPDDPDHVSRIEETLGRLTIPRGSDKVPCTEEGLRRFGVALRPELNNDPEAAFKEGVSQFKIGFDTFHQWWQNEPWLKQHSLVAVTNSSFDGASGLQHDGGLKSTRDEIYRFAHIILSPKHTDREFFAGRSAHGLVYGVPKPCLHGSDAHEIARLFQPEENRFCWIKADPTFEGLRQTLYEPEERVFIGEDPPRHFDPDGVIESISLQNTSGWFEARTIPINSSLVAIIGLKGSGKTALADMLAFAAGSSTDPEESFLVRAGEHIGGLDLSLAWASGLTEGSIVPHEPGGSYSPGVKYLSQKFVERLCSGDQLSEELLKEVEDVVFGHIPVEDRLAAADFQELRELRTGALRERRSEIAGLISTLSREIAGVHQRRHEIRGKEKRRQELERAIESLKKSRPKVADEAVARQLKNLSVAREARDKLSEGVTSLQRRKQEIDDLRKKLTAKYQEIASFWVATRAALVAAGFSPEEITSLQPVVPENWVATFQGRVNGLQQEIAKLTGGPGDSTQQPPTTLSGWKLKVEALEKEIKLSDEKKRQIVDSQRQEEKLALELDRIRREFRWLDETYPDERRQRSDERERLYLEFFDLLGEEQAILYELYEPLRQSLAAQGAHERKLELVCRVEVEADWWAQRGEDLFDLRRQGPMRETNLRQFAREHLEKCWLSCDREGIRKGIRATLALIKESEVVQDQLRAGNTLLSIADWLFSVDHISMTYGIRYDGKDLRLLSPGTKGIVLLILYLAVDRGDHRPLIVDQPDENLDNQSVYEILRGYFREAKKRRQIIIITHNPNLVVNTDAEQVIIAQAEVQEDGLPRMVYSLGSLESQAAEGPIIGSMREEICRILEGGREAFKMREQRYGDPEGPL